MFTEDSLAFSPRIDATGGAIRADVTAVVSMQNGERFVVAFAWYSRASPVACSLSVHEVRVHFTRRNIRFLPALSRRQPCPARGCRLSAYSQQYRHKFFVDRIINVSECTTIYCKFYIFRRFLGIALKRLIFFLVFLFVWRHLSVHCLDIVLLVCVCNVCVCACVCLYGPCLLT